MTEWFSVLIGLSVFAMVTLIARAWMRRVWMHRAFTRRAEELRRHLR